jgi:hypothetical protein
MAQEMQSTVKDWTFRIQHAQQRDLLNVDGALNNFISAESVVLAAGPPAKANAVMDELIPIGMCDSVSIQQNKNIIQLFEIGSRLPYILPGRTFAQLQLNRVVFNGDSLLGAVTTRNGISVPTGNDSPGLGAYTGSEDTSGGAFYLNLASSFFNSPFGLAILYQDSDQEGADNGKGQWVAAFYAENCLIQNHQMNIQGQQYIVMESALVRCTNIAPLAVGGTT